MASSAWGNPAGVKRDFAALEKRRLKAIGLLENNGLNQSAVACCFTCVSTDDQPVDERVQSRRQESLEESWPDWQEGKTDAGGSGMAKGVVIEKPGGAGL